jgi:putative hydrolase of the HAD superfamily
VSRFGAVVFDLFGTLVYEFPKADWNRWFVLSAEALGVDAAAFRREWEATAAERQTGRLGDQESNFRELCRRVGGDPTREQVAAALEVRRALYERCFVATPGAVETLEWLRARRVPTALVSMCAPDTPPLWRASPFAGLVDVEVFSSEVGLRKPDPPIYLYACERLGVEPGTCLYLGDGSYRELSGAAAVGMTAVLVVDPNAGEVAIARPEAREWTGPRVASIAEVRELL